MIGVRVFTTDGDEAGERFRYPETAAQALTERGYAPRAGQPGEWVKRDAPGGSLFASVRPDEQQR